MSIPDFDTASAAGAFSGITGTNGPSASAFSNLKASFLSEFTETAPQPPATAQASDTSTKSEQSTRASATAASATNASSNVPTTLVTSTLPSQGLNSPSASASDSPTGTAANAASSTSGDNPTVTEEDQCNGISCNSGLQAAIAVPIVVAALLIIALLFFLARRRRRRREAEPVSEKKQLPKKKWSRHLRVFSFDAELLMGGWRSSSNSIRSRQTGSVRSGQSSDHDHEPSIHSVDEVAPPYRDAVTTAQRPTGVTAPSRDPIPRPSSTATAPPPYGAVVGNTSRQSNRPTTPARDPFADASPISPIGESPFNDPPEDEDAQSTANAMMSRQSSLLRSIHEDGNSTLAGSDAGSIREAQLGRNLSVMSGGRTIGNVRGKETNP